MEEDSDLTRESREGQDFIPARTITAPDGRVLIFSCDQFVNDICQADCCFVCGARPSTKTFNGEHVIPRWLLKRFNLFDRQFTLPDGQTKRYGAYKMPCCEDCNTLLGSTVETPVSKLLMGSYDDIVARLDDNSIHLLFVWLCLLFLKVHLKDRSVPRNLDRRVADGWLADEYYWPEMHHLHCVARATYVGAKIDQAVFGSLLVFKIEDESTFDRFDYGDLTQDQTIVIRIGDFGLVAVLNDSGATQVAWAHRLRDIDGPLSTVQLREIAAMMATANSDLLNRPIFGSVIVANDGGVSLWARHDSAPELQPFDPQKFGAALAVILRGHLDHLIVENERGSDRLDPLIREGKVTFLWDEKGKFRPAAVHWEDSSQPD